MIDNNKFMMSDVLKGQIPELDDQHVDDIEEKYVHVVAERFVNNQRVPIAGLLQSVLFDVVPEIEIKVALQDALETANADGLSFGSFFITYGETKVTLKGPFIVKAARIQDINETSQTCVIALCLNRANR